MMSDHPLMEDNHSRGVEEVGSEGSDEYNRFPVKRVRDEISAIINFFEKSHLKRHPPPHPHPPEKNPSYATPSCIHSLLRLRGFH